MAGLIFIAIGFAAIAYFIGSYKNPISGMREWWIDLW